MNFQNVYWHIRELIRYRLMILFKLHKNTRYLIRKLNSLKNIIDNLVYSFSLSERYVSAKISGGLGNHLFLIAVGLAYAWKYSLTPIFEKLERAGSEKVPRPVYWATVFRKIPTTKQLPSNLAPCNDVDFKLREIPKPNQIANLKKQNGIFLIGGFQSAMYFSEYREKLLSILYYISPSEKEYLMEKYPVIFNKEKVTVALHIRRGDYIIELQNAKYASLYINDYYQNSISFFLKKFDSKNLLFVIFSDDLKWSKNFLNKEFPDLKLLFPREKDYLDLYLMSCCNHQIIANSTFSWWAAYLNIFPKKIVIAPKQWFGPKGYYYPNWDKIYVNDWIKI